MNKKSILIFGLGFLQKSLIHQCKLLNLYTIGIDPLENALCKNDVDVFEVIRGDDFDKTLYIAKKYNVSGIITTATDKPLLMMARVANAMNLPFFSEETAIWSTDKFQMKERFQNDGIPCANGLIIGSNKELDKVCFNYPVIVKPRDNSGSRGVIYCDDRTTVSKTIDEVLQYTHKNNVLVEEFIDGSEYSVESIHYEGETHVIQITQKITTKFPYNVELGHIEPATISNQIKNNIFHLIEKIAKCLNFENCGSHTELKIKNNIITIIETSPRLGGDCITSTLVPLSTGINIENILIKICIGEKIQKEDFNVSINKFSGIMFFELPEGIITSISNLDDILKIEGCRYYEFNLKVGDVVNKITNSIDRYGYVIFCCNNKKHLLNSLESANNFINKAITIKQ